ncbi:hypothetical protein JCM10207_008701 [Rhodosporidiobolus poonsookiae]
MTVLLDFVLLCVVLAASAYLFRHPPAHHKPASIAVVLLSADGDKFPQGLIDQGETAGKEYSRQLHTIVRREVLPEVKVLVYLVGNMDGKAALGKSGLTDAFLRGFVSSSELSFVASPFNGPAGFSGRMQELLLTFLSLVSTSHLFLGGQHNVQLRHNLRHVPPEFSDKLFFVRTGELALDIEELGQPFDLKVLDLSPQIFDVPETPPPPQVKPEVVDEVTTEPPPELVAVAVKPRRRQATGPRPLPTPPPIPPAVPFKVPWANFPPNNRPCNAYYLSANGCRTGDNCTFRHDMRFTAEEWEAYPYFVKSKPCPNIRKYGRCNYGDECYNGHRCAYTESACPWQEQCHFTLAGLPHSVRQ